MMEFIKKCVERRPFFSHGLKTEFFYDWFGIGFYRGCEILMSLCYRNNAGPERVKSYIRENLEFSLKVPLSESMSKVVYVFSLQNITCLHERNIFTLYGSPNITVSTTTTILEERDKMYKNIR